ncbi:hypothetical protein GCM10007304_32200 [Rhodococcoides trifolii]|uniref:Uncharacterized protein n=1 Tax=Rhodococcoides trifolii TaxID=908250 RepID=A0A917G017_9NOCA|nr:hypothetical protein [Rhodococcus trifolii]GGG15670.1 hypothetical protein GCM10007304_32200 [Rhodococcus trifolii]
MANYRVLDPTATVVATKTIDSAQDAHQWFIETKADNDPLGWRLEVQHDDDSWNFASDSD